MNQLIEQLYNCSVATIHEVIGQKNILDSSIRPLDRNKKMAGIVKTVKCEAGDNLTLIRAIYELKEKEVLVVDVSDDVEHGGFGEVLCNECIAKKCNGMVINGSVRDTNQIIELGFPVFCKGISVGGTTKVHHGEIGCEIDISGVTIHNGDYILGDCDGVVIVEKDEIEMAIQNANEREEKEKQIMNRLRNGESLYDIYGYASKWEESK